MKKTKKNAVIAICALLCAGAMAVGFAACESGSVQNGLSALRIIYTRVCRCT